MRCVPARARYRRTWRHMNNNLHTANFSKNNIVKATLLTMTEILLITGCGVIEENTIEPVGTEAVSEITGTEDTIQDDSEPTEGRDATQDESETTEQETDTAGQDETDVEFPYDEYEKLDDFGTYLVTEQDEQNHTETKTIYYFNSHTEQPVALRVWNMSWDEEQREGMAVELHIWDCLEEAQLYNGAVEWKGPNLPVNDAYYQDLFMKDLHRPWNLSADETIPTAKYVCGSEDDWDLENIDYESREELLSDCGFQDEEPYYQYFDRYGNTELELWFDESAGKGCGFYYSYGFNYDLDKVTWCTGFIFEGISVGEWVDDTYSLLTWEGTDAAEQEDVTQVIYGYADNGELSSYEVRGITEYVRFQWEEGVESSDDMLLSIDWIYRSDGTLYRKYYAHDAMSFATTGQSQRVYYDEQGRPIYKYEYITHGSYDYYYIYEGDDTIPKYCLLLDQNCGYSIPVMYVY